MACQPKIPEGHQAVMPYLIVKEPEALFEFLQKVFDAKQKIKVMNKDGTNVMHAEATIAGHCVMYGYADPFPEEPSGLSIAVPNVEEIYKKGIEAGATSIMEPCSPGWTAKFAGFKDQFGNTWWISEPQKTKEQPAVTPYFAPKDAVAFLEFLKKVFNAEEKARKCFPGSERIMHAETFISGNRIMVSSGSEEFGWLGGASVAVSNVDEVYKKALAEGATSIVEPTDFPWGRFSGWKDPFGVTWWVVGHQADATENVNPYVSPKDCVAFIDFVKTVFGAEEKMKNLTPEGVVSFCDLKVLGTVLSCCEGSEEKGYITGGIAVNVQDVDEIYNKAVAAGAISKFEPKTMPWGRFCQFKDSFGNTWLINERPKEENLQQGQGVWSNLSLKNTGDFLEFLKKVFNAQEKFRTLSEDGKSIRHAEATISGGTIMVAEGSEQYGYRNGGIFVYVPNVDETHKVALAAGATEVMAPCDMSDGRGSGIKDPFGNTFWLASSKKEEEVLGKRSATENGQEDLEPDVEKKIKQ